MARCVVIEDSDRVREIAVDILKSLGLDAEGAADPASGVDRVIIRQPELVLLDWDLPKLGALDVLSSLAEKGMVRKPTVVLMATENEPKQFALARAAGATHYVLKPFDADDIADIVSRCGIQVTRAA